MVLSFTGEVITPHSIVTPSTVGLTGIGPSGACATEMSTTATFSSATCTTGTCTTGTSIPAMDTMELMAPPRASRPVACLPPAPPLPTEPTGRAAPRSAALLLDRRKMPKAAPPKRAPGAGRRLAGSAVDHQMQRRIVAIGHRALQKKRSRAGLQAVALREPIDAHGLHGRTVRGPRPLEDAWDAEGSLARHLKHLPGRNEPQG